MSARQRLRVVRRQVKRAAARAACLACLGLTALFGCGTTQQNMATQQLLESDAVDAAVAQIDFTPLSGRKVFFDTTYIQDYKGIGFVNASYVISGLRQQLLAAGCELQEAKDKADVIVEGRLGTLGSDEHNVVYGIPKNNAINSVASAVPGSPSLPSIPELALAKKVASQGAAKLALFAYDRESRQPVWQSGLALARSSARDTWLLGAGPFQSGTIHRDKVRFAGRRVSMGLWPEPDGLTRGSRFAAYEHGAVFAPTSDAAVSETLLAEQSPANEAPQPLPADTQATPILAEKASKKKETAVVPVSHEAEAPTKVDQQSRPSDSPDSAPASAAQTAEAATPTDQSNAEPAPFPSPHTASPPLPPVEATAP